MIGQENEVHTNPDHFSFQRFLLIADWAEPNLNFVRSYWSRKVTNNL